MHHYLLGLSVRKKERKREREREKDRSIKETCMGLSAMTPGDPDAALQCARYGAELSIGSIGRGDHGFDFWRLYIVKLLLIVQL